MKKTKSVKETSEEKGKNDSYFSSFHTYFKQSCTANFSSLISVYVARFSTVLCRCSQHLPRDDGKREKKIGATSEVVYKQTINLIEMATCQNCNQLSSFWSVGL